MRLADKFNRKIKKDSARKKISPAAELNLFEGN